MAKKAKPAPEASGRRRSMVTPEGVDLGVQLASRGARLGAFLVDLAVLALVMFLLGWLVVAAMAAGNRESAAAAA